MKIKKKNNILMVKFNVKYVMVVKKQFLKIKFTKDIQNVKNI